MIGNAKTAFEEAAQQLFDDDITPLINKVNAMALEDIDLLKKDAEEVVANATKEIEGLIDHAAQVAQKLIDKSIEEIKHNIIDETADKVEEVTDDFFKGLDEFLQKFYEMVQKINCMVQGDIDKVYEDIYRLIGTGCKALFPDKCCRQTGLAGKTLKEMGDTQLYDLEICRRTSKLSVKTPVADLEKAYVDCQIAAKNFYCTNFAVASAKDFFTKEYNKWGVKYAFWAHPGDSSRAISAASHDDPCGNPVECYQQAIQKLNEARDEIKDKADMAVVQPLIDQVKDKADMAVVQPLIDQQKEELKIFHNETCPEGWVESEITKGYLLVGRPKDGKTGDQINTPLANEEKARVGPHSHEVTVNDKGHGHDIADPGHTHAFPIDDPRTGYNAGLSWTAPSGGATNAASKTGITVNSANANIDVSVKATASEGYPLAYVLICQRAVNRSTNSLQTFQV